MARLFRKYENDEEALSEYKVYQRMGVEDTTVRREVEQYKAELKRKAESKPPATTTPSPGTSGAAPPTSAPTGTP